jgi:NADH:ubiquinone oxidoreductase subunit
MGLGSIFTWWHGPGLGTRLVGWRTGREVGRDGYGNIYYVSRAGRRPRRWVIYNGDPEASRIPPEWHLWLHKTVDTTPDEAPLKARVWEKPWVPNLTGTPAAHRPSGSLAVTATRARTTGDYEAWSPE